eukprot:3001179-Amphidinium_carterae.1
MGIRQMRVATTLTCKNQPRHHRLLHQWHPLQCDLVSARAHRPVPLLTATPRNPTHSPKRQRVDRTHAPLSQRSLELPAQHCKAATWGTESRRRCS